ncbi:MAG: zinc dependent phospholipase C family protein [Spirochaetes bacterium]|nr:zinc dependent phospholipase C family protein [Spirochaetota bacterium]
MPSQILHTIFGKNLIAGLQKRLEKDKVPPAQKTLENITCEHGKILALGCQGADIFYHSQRQRPVAISYGSLLHRRDFGNFAAALLETALPYPPLAAYALGFASHAILDRHCHPYIIYKAGKKYHAFFERIIDVFMLKKLELQEVQSWDQEGILGEVCENPPAGLKELLVETMARAFPEKVNADPKLLRRIENAFADAARFYRMSAPAKTTAKQTNALSTRALMYVFPENLPGDIDFLNQQKTPWRYPYLPPALDQAPKDDCRSFMEIYNEALEAAINILAPCISEYFQSGKFPVTETAGKLGNTSLSIQDEHGKPCQSNLHGFLPLEEVLAQQAEMRGMKLHGAKLCEN